jgi:hypothetical protein
MRPQQNLVVFALLTVATVVALLILASANLLGSGRFHYGAHSLESASPEEIGRFAIEYLRAQNNIRSGTPEILLTRSIRRADIGALGLGCVGSSPSIEEPPLVLVILRGDFDFSRMLGSSAGPSKANSGFGYLAIAFDLWAATPMYQKFSSNPEYFKVALGNANSATPLVCPTEQAVPKSLHYGEVAPTPSLIPFPTVLATSLPVETPSPRPRSKRRFQHSDLEPPRSNSDNPANRWVEA